MSFSYRMTRLAGFATVVLSTLVALGLSSISIADTIHVPGDYPTIQAAVDAAVDGDEVVVAPGTYFERVEILNKEIILRSSDGPDVTVIDGEELGRVLLIENAGALSELRGFTIQNGDTLNYGGGIYLQDSDTTVSNCRFVNNAAAFWGGGLGTYLGSPLIENCLFERNYSSRGGGAKDFGGTATFRNCRFSENRAAWGAGMVLYQSHTVFDGCTFERHSTGEAFFVDADSFAEIRSCRFIENETVGISGGTYYGWCRIFIQDSLFESNLGAIYVSPFEGELLAVNCRFVRNAGISFGGLSLSSGWPNGAGFSAQLINCYFEGNTASEGAGVLRWSHNGDIGQLHMVNCTMINNASDAGIGLDITPGSAVSLDNCIVRECGSQPIVGDADVRYSNIEGGYPGEGNIDADPRFMNPAMGDYRLGFYSPCIDAGDNNAVPVDIETDLNGDPRFVDDPRTDDTGLGTPPIVDMGAYEYAMQPFMLRVAPSPIIAGEPIAIEVVNARPDDSTWLLYSVLGEGNTFIPQLNVTVDLDRPRLAGGSQTTNALGDTAWQQTAPNLSSPRSIWIQSVQRENKSNLFESWIEP